MDTHAAVPNQSKSGPGSDNVPIPWITFGGSLEVSSGEFVQCVQRIAFQQGRSRDDGWQAEYAATCFEGDALTWYAELEDEVQGSWRKLRVALLRQYPPTPGASHPWPNASHTGSFPPANVGADAPWTNPSKPQGLAGRIDVVANNTMLHGYLSFTPDSGIDLTLDKDKAVIVSFSPGEASDVLQLDMRNAPSRILPYLGVALLVPPQNDPNTVPDVLPGVLIGYINGPGNRIGRVLNAPKASSRCKVLPAITSGEVRLETAVEFATWTLSACGESRRAPLYRRRADTHVSSTRAAAAVWKYDINLQEFRIVWLMDDNTECELGGYVHRGTSERVHLHRISDMDKTGGVICEDRVRFIFQSIS